MKLIKEINKKESGQAFILVLILLLVGALMIGPLLGFMGTGLVAGQTYEERVAEVYAADAGVEDAIYKIMNHDPSLPADETDSITYQLTDPINGETVDVTVTKLSLVQGLLGEDEYKIGQPHEDWVTPDIQPSGEEGVYTCTLSFNYLEEYGQGSRLIESVGTYFSPLPNKDVDQEYEEIIGVPVVFDTEGVFEDSHFNTPPLQEDSSPEIKIASGGFAYIWRWEKNQGPLFDKNNRIGEFSCEFEISDPGWAYGIYFVWATFREQDISYITSADFYKWLIEATAGDTTVLSAIMEDSGVVDMLTWEINPPG